MAVALYIFYNIDNSNSSLASRNHWKNIIHFHYAKSERKLPSAGKASQDKLYLSVPQTTALYHGSAGTEMIQWPQDKLKQTEN